MVKQFSRGRGLVGVGQHEHVVVGFGAWCRLATVSRAPSLMTRLTQAFSPQGRSPIALPSAGAPAATW
jgi:hypothetical protein